MCSCLYFLLKPLACYPHSLFTSCPSSTFFSLTLTLHYFIPLIFLIVPIELYPFISWLPFSYPLYLFTTLFLSQFLIHPTSIFWIPVHHISLSTSLFFCCRSGTFYTSLSLLFCAHTLLFPLSVQFSTAVLLSVYPALL